MYFLKYINGKTVKQIGLKQHANNCESNIIAIFSTEYCETCRKCFVHSLQVIVLALQAMLVMKIILVTIIFDPY